MKLAISKTQLRVQSHPGYTPSRVPVLKNIGNKALDHSRVGCRFSGGQSIDTTMINASVPRLMNMPGSLTMCNSADNADTVAQDETYVDCIAEGSHFEGAMLTRVTFTDCDLYWGVILHG